MVKSDHLKLGAKRIGVHKDYPVAVPHGPPSAVFGFQAIVGCLTFGVEGLCCWVLLCSSCGAPDPPMMVSVVIILACFAPLGFIS